MPPVRGKPEGVVRASAFRLGFKKPSPFLFQAGPGNHRGARVFFAPAQAVAHLSSVGGNVAATRRLSLEPANQSFAIAMPDVTATRRLTFNAAHRVHNAALSDEENARLFGKCNNPNGHGHNYTLDVSVRGPIDSRTGYVLDLGVLKRIVTERVVDRLDHKHLNLDVDFMRGVNPTAENIVVAIWRQVAPAILPAQLVRLVLWETPNNYVEYTGE
jgi:6-pyruvoyltetrahydropterin/6-carboxytetrahydropterin synthase